MIKIDCFLACFDVLGFKVLRQQKTTEGLFKLYDRYLLPAMQHVAAGAGKSIDKKYVPDFSTNSLNYRVFSDTVILFTNDLSFSSFYKIVNASHQLLSMSFVGSKAPFRGAIGIGDLIYNQQGVLVGEAMEDAYKWESKQAWAGCLFSNNFESFIKSQDYLTKYKKIHKIALFEQPQNKKDILLNAKKIINNNVPLYVNPKKEKIKYYNENKLVLDWTIRTDHEASSEAFLPHNNEEHAKLIIQNTKDFEIWAKTNNR